MTKKKLARKPKTKKKKTVKKFQEYRVELTLKEKLKNSEKKKHSKSIRVTSTEDQIKNTFKDLYKNRDKEELVLSIYEVNEESGRSKRTPFLSKKIFPTKTIRYTDIVNQFDVSQSFGQMIEKEYLPLFKYFLRTKKIDLEHEVKFIKHERKVYYRTDIHVEYEAKLARTNSEINGLRNEWAKWLYHNLRDKIMEAITDPNTNAEEFKELLENTGYFTKSLYDDNEIEIYRDVTDLISDPQDVYDQWHSDIVFKNKKTGAEIKLTCDQLDCLVDQARNQLGM